MNSCFSIFLDFDGVLITKFSTPSPQHPGLAFDPVCVDILKRLIISLKQKFNHVNIIVVSNWRYDMEEADICQILLQHYGLGTFVNEVSFIDKNLNKSEGIKQYIRVNRLEHQPYIILDDEKLDDELAKFHIQTRYEDGIRGLNSIDDICSIISHKGEK